MNTSEENVKSNHLTHFETRITQKWELESMKPGRTIFRIKTPSGWLREIERITTETRIIKFWKWSFRVYVTKNQFHYIESPDINHVWSIKDE